MDQASHLLPVNLLQTSAVAFAKPLAKASNDGTEYVRDFPPVILVKPLVNRERKTIETKGSSSMCIFM